MANIPQIPERWSFPKCQPDLSVRVVEGETVIFDRQGGLVHQLNHTASVIWQQCDGKSSVTDIAKRFAQEFDIDYETAARDVLSLLGQLRLLSLLKCDYEEENVNA